MTSTNRCHRMAYDHHYNPNALSEHAEPEQVFLAVSTPDYHLHNSGQRLLSLSQTSNYGPQRKPLSESCPSRSRLPSTLVSGNSKNITDALRTAPFNGDWTSFDLQTVKMMIRMFDSRKSAENFRHLWELLTSWRTLFDCIDEDATGMISYSEYRKALVALEYNLSSSFVDSFFGKFVKRPENGMSFNLFVWSFIELKRCTDVFKGYDDDQDGYISLSFEEFIDALLPSFSGTSVKRLV